MRKKKKKKHGSARGKINLFSDYSSLPFRLLHLDLDRQGYDSEPHKLRRSFWNITPKQIYEKEEAVEILQTYSIAIENYLKEIIQLQSLMYWLHVGRRIFPRLSFTDNPITTMFTRSIMDASIQKYATVERCDRIENSSQTSPDNIFCGLLKAPEFSYILNTLKKEPQFVLTKFGIQELREFYEMEKLAYEMWRTGAHLRSVGKGAILVSTPTPPFIEESCSEEIDGLIFNYDNRLGDKGNFISTATGTVFENAQEGAPGIGQIILPTFNVSRQKADGLKLLLLKSHHIKMTFENTTNFRWGHFDIRGYYKAHLPYREAFNIKTGTSLEDALCIVAALGFAAMYLSIRDPGYAIRMWQRAYEAPSTKDNIMDVLNRFLPHAKYILGLNGDFQIDLESGFKFWELNEDNRQNINMLYPGPHYIFLPFDGRIIIDYTWIIGRLYYLFYDVNIPDQNFKGNILEEYIRNRPPVLPHSQLKSLNGQTRQIDSSYLIDNILIIVECRAIGRSIAFERGDKQAIDYRNSKMDKALEDIDEKANWLAANPIGVNYNITMYDFILPIAVTPFIEYISSIENRYWINENTPRVLNPYELVQLLDNIKIDEIKFNLIRLK